MGPLFVPADNDDSSSAVANVRHLFWVEAGLAGAVLLGSVLYFPDKPAVAPSESAARKVVPSTMNSSMKLMLTVAERHRALTRPRWQRGRFKRAHYLPQLSSTSRPSPEVLGFGSVHGTPVRDVSGGVHELFCWVLVEALGVSRLGVLCFH